MNTKEQVLSFYEKCEELKSCKFIMATTKIKDLLKCIVNCADIYRMIEEVTSTFNYPRAKSKCLISIDDGAYRHNYCILPQPVGERIAFCFCLLVEFDNATIVFNDFLAQYFPENGTYHASYRAFCDTVISGLQNAVCEVFKNELESPAAEISGTNAAKAEYISAIGIAISGEQQYIAASKTIPEEEKEGALEMLNKLLEAVREGNAPLINALIFGYNYFVLYHKCVSEGVGALIKEITAYEQIL